MIYLIQGKQVADNKGCRTWKEQIIMNTYVVKYQSFNRADYDDMVSAKNEKDAFKAAQNLTVKRDDRDKVISITEHNELNTYLGN